ncbi:hypothetical protein BaRGS_00025265 [Batillaria attramentaria]|uniref:Hexosyltransferase n=1 Tax=Batillaria attramentaria TaxID=370345 RepID=A0ABD0K8Q5_9CAEN
MLRDDEGGAGEMTWRMTRVRNWLRWPRGSRSTSRVLVSVYVQNAMHPRGLSSRSRRILLTTSIWSLVVLLLVFFITYTVLLVYVDHPFQTSGSDSFSDSPSPHQFRPKVRFNGRGYMDRARQRNGSSLMFSSGTGHRKKVWDAAMFDDPGSSLPECKHGSLFIVIITSAPDHSEHRREIRNSWCNPTLSNHEPNAWQCVFLIGKTDGSDLESHLQEESAHHKDILRGSYVDSYRNLTYKVMHGLAWLHSNCEAPYILKTDDDCFVSTHLLWQFLMHQNKQTSNLYAGHMVLDPSKRQVIRDPGQKWSVAEEEYRPDTYPPYASGSGYALSFDVVAKAVEESRVVKPIPNEDAYIGILLDRLGIQPTVSGRFILSSAGLRLCNYMYMFVVHGVELKMHKDMHKKMLTSQIQCKEEDEVADWF